MIPPSVASHAVRRLSRVLRWVERYPAVALAWAVAGVAVLPWDCAIARVVVENPLRGDLRRLVNLSEVFGYGLSAMLIVATAMVLDRRGWRVGWRLAATTFGSGLASNLLKTLIARHRPSAADLSAGVGDTFQGWLPMMTRPGDWGYSLQSFPSSHTATAVGLAAGLAVLYPRGRFLFLLFAAGAALQRVASSAHFASDCFFGAAVAWLVSGFLVQTKTFRGISRARTAEVPSTQFGTDGP
ncbi:MAG: phosphatase PAP2 family protein [Planctomycetes bacterium]|nr:phosphatase PAP2 family protein [Planctomycetota bacterium]